MAPGNPVAQNTKIMQVRGKSVVKLVIRVYPVLDLGVPKRCIEQAVMAALVSAIRGYVIKDEGDAVLLASIHHTMALLVIDLVRLSHLELVGPAINHESNTAVGGDGNMDPVAATK